jgi:hypothetical protein
MKCKNCGLSKAEHRARTSDSTIWDCPDGSGTSYPATVVVKVELYYQAGEDNPWIVKWDDTTVGSGEVVSGQAADALERAGRAIAASRENETSEEEALDDAARGSPRVKS